MFAATIDRPVASPSIRTEPIERLREAHDAWLTPVLTARAPARLPQDVEQILDHLVAGRDHARVGRIGLLGDDELGEFLGDVGIGAFHRGADEPSPEAVDRLTRSSVPRRRRR